MTIITETIQRYICKLKNDRELNILCFNLCPSVRKVREHVPIFYFIFIRNECMDYY